LGTPKVTDPHTIQAMGRNVETERHLERIMTGIQHQ
jgi:hypothetical protein